MNKIAPLFSIVIPTYNRSEFITIAINSVISQTISDWELIIVDDGSTDNTESLIKQFIDPRIRYFKTLNNERGAARNFGIEKAVGKWICFLDSDDYLLLNHLEVAFEIIFKQDVVQIFHLNYEFRDLSNNLTIPSRFLPSILNPLLVIENPICCNSIFFPQSIIVENKFNENRVLAGSEDYLLWLSIASKYTIYHYNQTTVVVVDHVQRSMHEKDFGKLQQRIFKFIELSKNNALINDFIGNKWKLFVSYRMTYISLQAAIGKFRSDSVKYLFLSLKTNFQVFFTKRFLVIIKLILSP